MPPRPPSADNDLFKQAMRDVRPLSGRQEPLPVITDRVISPATSAPIGLARLEVVEQWGEVFVFAAPGVDQQAIRAVRRGDKKPEATLDLHGLTVDRVEKAMRTFLDRAQAAGQRTVLIISGRGRGSGPGGPVVRERMLTLLSGAAFSAMVLVAASAPPALGGGGAALVRLRKATL